MVHAEDPKECRKEEDGSLEETGPGEEEVEI